MLSFYIELSTQHTQMRLGLYMVGGHSITLDYSALTNCTKIDMTYILPIAENPHFTSDRIEPRPDSVDYTTNC